MTTRDIMANTIAGGLQANLGTSLAKQYATEALQRRIVVLSSVASFAAANASMAETAVFVAVRPIRVKQVQYCTTGVNVAADNTNYRTFTCSKRDAAGAAGFTIATRTFQNTAGNGAITTCVPWTVTLSTNDSNTVLAAGETLTMSAIGTGATPVALTAGSFTFDTEEYTP